MNLCVLKMQSGISFVNENYEPKPRRSIDPAAFTSQSILPPKPSGIHLPPKSKTPASYAIKTRNPSSIQSYEDPTQPNALLHQSSSSATSPLKSHPSTNTINQCTAYNTTRRLNYEFNLEDHIKKTRQAGKYLKQIIHAKDCPLPQCTFVNCLRTKQILLHVNECQSVYCQIPGCQTTKRLLDHSKTCENSWYKINGTTTAQQDFCLLCTIACCEENNRQLHQLPIPSSSSSSTTPLTRQPSYSYEDTDTYNMNEKDATLLPMISDEIIEFSRVPFQSFPSSLPHHNNNYNNNNNNASVFSPRAKTYSDSNFEVSNEPNKKQRSKSWAVPSSPSFQNGNNNSNNSNSNITTGNNSTPVRGITNTNIINTTPFGTTSVGLLFPRQIDSAASPTVTLPHSGVIGGEAINQMTSILDQSSSEMEY